MWECQKQAKRAEDTAMMEQWESFYLICLEARRKTKLSSSLYISTPVDSWPAGRKKGKIGETLPRRFHVHLFNHSLLSLL